MLIEILSDILQTTVRMEDNFYSLGGDSIKALQASAHFGERDLLLQANDILTHPLIKDMIPFIRIQSNNDDQNDYEGIVPLTPIIEWFIDKTFQLPNQYYQCLPLQLSKQWKPEQLARILNILAVRHDALRLRLKLQSRTLFLAKHLHDPIDIPIFHVLCEENAMEYANRLDAIVKSLADKLDLETGQLMQSALIQRLNGKQIWMILIHHIAVDMVSWQLLIQDIQTLMDFMTKCEEPSLPPHRQSFLRYARCLADESSAYDNEKEFWETAAAETVKSVFEDRGYSNCQISTQSLDKETTDHLLGQANAAYRTKTQELLIAALALAIGESFHMDCVQFAIEGHGRNALRQIDVSQTVGWFTSLYPLRIPVVSIDLDRHLKQVKETIRAVPREGFGYGLCSSIQNRWHKEMEWCRFNYLGKQGIDTRHFCFDLQAVIDRVCQLPMTNTVDVLCYIDDKGELKLIVRTIGEAVDAYGNMVCRWKDWLQRVVRFCVEAKEVSFTPSDFDAVQITQEEIDLLLQ